MEMLLSALSAAAAAAIAAFTADLTGFAYWKSLSGIAARYQVPLAFVRFAIGFCVGFLAGLGLECRTAQVVSSILSAIIVDTHSYYLALRKDPNLHFSWTIFLTKVAGSAGTAMHAASALPGCSN